MRIQFPVLTLLNRELRLESRHWRTYVVRIMMLAVIWVCIFAAEKASRYIGAPGKQFFASLMTLNMVLATLAGLSVFASAITEEKEEMTLGLMRMTSLNPVTILLGKSTAKMFNVIVLLVAQVPFTILAVTMGGVSMTQIAAAYVLLGAYVVFVANAALFCSVIGKRTAWAVALMVGLLFVMIIAPIWIRESLEAVMMTPVAHPTWLLQFADWIDWWTTTAMAPAAVISIFQSGFDGPIVSTAVVSNLVAGTVFFLLSLLVFDWFTRNEIEDAPSRSVLKRAWRGLRVFSAGRAWKRAVLWKEFHFTSGGWTMMICKLVVAALPLPATWVYLSPYHAPIEVRLPHLGNTLMGWAIFFASIDIIVYAARMFAVERRWDTLSAIVTLPMSARRLWYLKLLGGLPRLAPWALMFAAGACLAPASLRDGVEDVRTSEGIIYFVCVSLFFLHMLIWLTLKLRRWAFLVSLGVMFVMYIGLSILSVFVAMMGAFMGINTILLFMRLFGLGLGAVGIVLHFVVPYEIERAAAKE